jgi:hypothetical protein
MILSGLRDQEVPTRNSIPKLSLAQVKHPNPAAQSRTDLWFLSTNILSACFIYKIKDILTLVFSSYLIVPYGNTSVAAMSPTVKKWVKWMRIVQLVLRCFELLCAGGLLAMLIPIKGIDISTGWIMRIVVSYSKCFTQDVHTDN